MSRYPGDIGSYIYRSIFSELYNRNRNRKLEISTAPTKAKSRGPAYSNRTLLKKFTFRGLIM